MHKYDHIKESIIEIHSNCHIKQKTEKHYPSLVCIYIYTLYIWHNQRVPCYLKKKKTYFRNETSCIIHISVSHCYSHCYLKKTPTRWCPSSYKVVYHHISASKINKVISQLNAVGRWHHLMEHPKLRWMILGYLIGFELWISEFLGFPWEVSIWIIFSISCFHHWKHTYNHFVYGAHVHIIFHT